MSNSGTELGKRNQGWLNFKIKLEGSEQRQDAHCILPSNLRAYEIPKGVYNKTEKEQVQLTDDG